MRQVGVLAAAAQVALDTMIDRLAEDHRRADALAASLDGLPGIKLLRPGIQTNMVFLDISGTGMSASEFLSRCRDRGLLVSTTRRDRVRLVTNRHIDDEAVQQAARILREVVYSA